MSKDGKHYPSKEFRENYATIFGRKKIKLAPKTTKQFLEGLENEKDKNRN